MGSNFIVGSHLRMFYQAGLDAFCMAVNPTIINGQHMKLSLIETTAQQNYIVGYTILVESR